MWEHVRQLDSRSVISRRKDHTKYVVRLITFDAGGGHVWIVSAGWDRKVRVYDLVLEENRNPTLPEPRAHIEIAKQPPGDSAYDES